MMHIRRRNQRFPFHLRVPQYYRFLSLPSLVFLSWTLSSSCARAYSSPTHKQMVNNTTGPKKPVVIFCHGSGDTGPGAKAWIRALASDSEYSQFQWIFPSAKPIPYQLNGGAVTSIWYDRIDGFAPTNPEHTGSVEQSTEQLLNLIEEQVQSGVSPSQIAIGGFSMGGAIALQTAARWHANNATPLGSVFGLSCYLNYDSKVWDMLEATSNQWPPTYMAHGAADGFISPQWGEETLERLQRMGVKNSSFRLLPHVTHDMTESEIADILRFLELNLYKETIEYGTNK